MRIFGSVDNTPPQWLEVRLRINLPQIGNEIRVKSIALWVEPKDWVKVRVSKVTKGFDGQVIYSLTSQYKA